MTTTTLSWGFLLLVPMALLVLGLPAIALWLALRHPREAPDGGRCAKCGYGVRGIDSWTCPECGADLRESGIAGPRSAGGRFFVAATAWLVFVTLAGLAMTFIATRIASPSNTFYHHRRTIFIQAPAWNATLTAHHQSPQQIRLELTSTPNVPPLHVDWQTNHCVIGHNGNVKVFNATTLLDWAGQKQTPRDADTLNAANDVIVAVRQMVQSPSTGFTYTTHVTAHPVNVSGSHSTSRQSATAQLLPLMGIAVAVLFGMAGVLWMKGRMQPSALVFVGLLTLWLGGVTLVAALFFVA